ncbi:hypothetical protein Tco_0181833 [Tanacetum coccineum]
MSYSDNSKENSDKSLVKEQVSQVKSSFVEGCGSNTSKSVSKVEPKEVRKNNDAPIIEDWVSDDEEQDEWNEYLRKGRKTKPKRQNHTRNGKDCERQSQIRSRKVNQVKKSTEKSTGQSQSQPSQPRQIQKSTCEEK